MEFLKIILSASLLGLILSFVLLGPVFFLVIETSITRGVRAALALDLGVITADSLYIFICSYGSKEVSKYLATHPESFTIGGLIMLVFGLFQAMAKGNLHFRNEINPGKNYFSMFFKGFILNFVNMSVLIFWLVTVIIVNANFHHDFYMVVVFFSVLLGIFFAIDILKILLARKFKNRLTDAIIYKFKKMVGIIIIVGGVYLIIRGFGTINIQNEIEKHPLEHIEKIKSPSKIK